MEIVCGIQTKKDSEPDKRETIAGKKQRQKKKKDSREVKDRNP
jgi:hypothetical protein